MVSILIADRCCIFRYGLSSLIKETLGNCIIETCNDSNSTVTMLKERHFDLLVVDPMMSPPGLSFVSMLTKTQKGLRILVASEQTEGVFAKRFFDAGALGYIEKRSPIKDFITAITVICKGQHYVSDTLLTSISNYFFGKELQQNPFLLLSSREYEIMMFLIQGSGHVMICKALKLRPSTISTYKNRILQKLDVKNIIQLAQKAKLYGISFDTDCATIMVA